MTMLTGVLDKGASAVLNTWMDKPAKTALDHVWTNWVVCLTHSLKVAGKSAGVLERAGEEGARAVSHLYLFLLLSYLSSYGSYTANIVHCISGYHDAFSFTQSSSH